MARIRSIKPEFWTSEQVVECSPTARLLFVGLWTFSDDGGVHPYAPKRLKLQIFPGDNFDDQRIIELLAELQRAKLIRTFTANDGRFIFVTGWRHQKIEKPTYRWPQPDEETKFDDDSAIGRQVAADNSLTDRRSVDGCSPTDGSGVDGNGKDQKKTPLPPLPAILDRDDFIEAITAWLRYKGRGAYKPAGLAALVSRAAKIAKEHGVSAVIEAMERARANGWQGWDQQSSYSNGNGNGRLQTAGIGRVGPGQRHKDD
jgi:hypothetical protein